MHACTDMQIFVEVVQAGGFAAAARHLGLAASVVGDRVRSLEKRLNIRLLNRTTRQQQLTEAGQLYFTEALNILAATQTLEQRLVEHSCMPHGLLKITAPIPLGRQKIAPFIGEFIQHHPTIQVHLNLEDRFTDILAEGFDIAIRGGPQIDTNLTGRQLFTTRRVLVASPEYLAQTGIPEHPQELAKHACLAFNQAPHLSAEWRFGRGKQAHSQRINACLTTTHSELPVIWALAGLGITQKSWWEVERYLHTGQLVTVLDAYEPEPIHFFAIYPVSRSQSRKVDLFIEALLTTFAEFNSPTNE